MMVTLPTARAPVPFVFICGAVGSGNTLMFDCLTRDEHAYGVNEDGLGGILERFLQSEKDFGRCPHCIEAYQQFLDTLRRDRRTLVLKTPSNLRRRAFLKQHLDDPFFIMMVREPHAAIVSGLRRHGAASGVEAVAEIWLRDYEQYAQPDDRSIVVAFENLVCSPRETLTQVAQSVMPLSDRVFRYAESVASPQRAAPAWWRSKIDSATEAEIERCVRQLKLDEYYGRLQARSGLAPAVPNNGERRRISRLNRATDKVREWAVKGWYRLKS